MSLKTSRFVKKIKQFLTKLFDWLLYIYIYSFSDVNKEINITVRVGKEEREEWKNKKLDLSQDFKGRG